MQRFEDEHRVELAGVLRVGRVAVLEGDAIVDSLFLRVLAGPFDRRTVEVDAHDGRAGIRARERDRRPAETAAGVEDASAGLLQPGVQVGHAVGEPIACEERLECRGG